MSDPSTARVRRSRICRGSTAVLLASGLSVCATAVVSAGGPTPVHAIAPSAVNVVGLEKGDYGDAVRALQEALNRVGIGVKYGVDGYFGSATQASVKAFQNYKKLSVTGVVDAPTAAALGFAAPAPAAAAVAPAAAGSLAYGSTGAAVSQLQQLLINAGQSVGGGIDGLYGLMTVKAIKAFQTAKGLPVTGKADAATMQALQSGSGQPAAAPAGTVAQGARGTTVRQLQQALLTAGIAVAGGVDGIFGAATLNAVKAFQQAKGIGVTGVVDSATAAALALGGNATPQAAPPANATSVVGLRLGARGPAVVQLQKAIISMGWRIAGGADGIFGAATQSALIMAQKANGVPASGAVDDATARLFALVGGSSPATPSQPAAGGATADGFAAYDERGARVVSVQRALIAAGITVRGGADGIFGAATASGIMMLQRAKGLPATGKLDAATAAALGLSAAAAPAPSTAVAVALEAKPVQGPCYYGDTWTASRGNGRVHLGVDIMAAEGKELYAVVTGRVTQLYSAATDALAGNGLKVARPDGTYVFYAHLSALAPGIAVGTPVTAGQVIGYVGHTGNAGLSHLHLEVHPGGGSAINPYPIVKAVGAC